MAIRTNSTGASSRSDELAAAIRRQIVSGEFMPGHRLPTFQELETDFSVSRGMVQMAIERLKRDGFVNAASRQGLFVAPHPPHLRRYGIIFPVTQSDPAWSRFDQVLVGEAHLLQRAGDEREFEVFAGSSDYREGKRVLDRVYREVQRDRLAGLIFTPGTFDLARETPLNDSSLPKAFIFEDIGHGQRPTITGDGDNILKRSLRHLAEQGCQRVAVVHVEGTASRLSKELFAAQGLAFHPHWIQTIGRGDTTVLATLIPLLLHGPADQRPDGLLVLDDNLVDHVTAAVMGMGLRIGHDLQMVAHSNWPVAAPCALPIRRIGFHVGQILARSIDVIDMQRRGETPPEIQYIPALFEDEINPV